MGKEEIRRLREIIAGSKRIVFFGGAGVSTASGIPDFRSAGGLYSQAFEGFSPETVLSSTFFYLHPELFFDFYRKNMLFPSARPNAAHHYLAELEKRDVLRGIVTLSETFPPHSSICRNAWPSPCKYGNQFLQMSSASLI